MYTRITRSGGRSYLQIVEGFRTETGVRQRVVANLGRLEQLDGKKLDPLIHGLQRALGRVPALVMSRGRRLPAYAREVVEHLKIPVMRTQLVTGHFMNNATVLLQNMTSPRIRVAGTMVEINGVGVLLEGEPGIGKSEIALALIERGHSLVSDDTTVLMRDSTGTIQGSAVEITRHHMEIRGLGIIHVPSLFGIASMRNERRLDLIICMRKAENVGGEILDTVLPLMNTFGRIPVCGLISAYNATSVPEGPKNLRAVLTQRLRMQGLIVFDWADRIRAGADVPVTVRANADNSADAAHARHLGAEGIGLCRTEHMLLADDRLPLVRRFILTDVAGEGQAALADLEEVQQADFEGLLAAMDGLPITVRLLDPPLHEFLPELERLVVAEALGELDEEGHIELAAVRRLHEVNPMIGTRGVRLGVIKPGLYQMQVRALLRAVAAVRAEGRSPRVEVMIPLVIAGVLLSTLHQSSLGSLYLIVPHKLHPLWYSGQIFLFFFISAIIAERRSVGLKSPASSYRRRTEPSCMVTS